MELVCPLCKNCTPAIAERISADIVAERYNVLGLDVSKYLTGLSEVLILRCETTGYRFYYPKEIIGDSSFYEELNHKIGTVNYYVEEKWEYQFALKQFTETSDLKILDIGCGSGAFLDKIKTAKIKDGIEFNDVALEILRKKDISAMTISIQEMADMPDHQNKYDVITAFQVLEHIYDVNSFISSCIKCLTPGGTLIFGTPNNTPFIYSYDKLHVLNLPPHHMGLWNKQSYQKLPAIFPLRVKAIQTEPFNKFDYGYYLYQLCVKRLGFKWGERIYYRLVKFIVPVLLPFSFLSRRRNRNIIAVFEKIQ